MSSTHPNPTTTAPNPATPKPPTRPRSKSKIAAIALITFALFLSFPLFYFWITAPPDPIFEGQRLSSILNDAFLLHQTTLAAPSLAAQKTDPWRKCRAALKHLGTEASPLLTDWLHGEPTLLHKKIRGILLKNKIDFPFFTADRPQFADEIFWFPEAAVAVALALQQHIVKSDNHSAIELAHSYERVFNSIDEPSRKLIASRSAPFIQALLDRFERDREDIYALALIGMILKADTDFLPPDQKARILKLEPKSHYLTSAAQALR
jgi:hypothetical protein